MEKLGGNCDALLLLAALLSIQMARGLSQERVELLSAFFEVLADDLALLALCPSDSGDSTVEAVP